MSDFVLTQQIIEDLRKALPESAMVTMYLSPKDLAAYRVQIGNDQIVLDEVSRQFTSQGVVELKPVAPLTPGSFLLRFCVPSAP